MKTLILDQGWQPHRVVTWQRAVGMLFGGKVEVVEEYDDEIRSVSLVIRTPAVVRLLTHVRPRKRVIRFSRYNVMTRDEFRCQYCGIRRSPRELTCDHVVPVSRGGVTNWDNLVTACKPCNHRKGSRTPEEAGMALARRPEKPKQLPLVPFQLRVNRVPDAWQLWVYWSPAPERIAAGA